VPDIDDIDIAIRLIIVLGLVALAFRGFDGKR
jgi:hypothetical protein